MGAFARSSSSALLLLLAAGCTDELPPIEGTASLRVTVVSPTDLGSAETRLPDSDRTVTLDIVALDNNGEEDTTLSGPLDVYVHFLGGLTPQLGTGDPPFATVTMTGGHADGVTVDLPATYGPTFLWIEDGSGDDPTFATGTSATLWYRDAYLADTQRPVDESAFDALLVSPLAGKQAIINTSEFGATGKLVVTGVYGQGYTVSDVDCPGGNPPCTPGDYGHGFVYSFNYPVDENGRGVRVGNVVAELRGGISDFNGLTEIGFPQTFLATSGGDPILDESLVPEPVVLQPEWLSSGIDMEKVEGALVAVDNATLCPLDDQFTTYQQWELDIGLGCGVPVSVISAGQVASFDPTPYVGQVLPRVVGTLRPVNFADFDVWIIYPRDASDIETP
ncbi:MAG TPA: hypothetical protein VL172_22380 [Kofleriaceae bacterium]|jgi:hypothetical protein|nr:hypothetical protein [Kofleriaceae bacterium]